MAIEITIEKVWRYKKSTCIAIINHITGTRCGYCSVSMAHPFFGKSYTDDPISDLEHKIDEVICVHGGVTYSGELDWLRKQDQSIPHNQWWFGFDCCHGGDIQDPELILDPIARELVEDTNRRFKDIPDGSGMFKRTKKDLEFVIKNCKDMADHLAKFVYNSVDFILDAETNLHDVSKSI